MESLLVRSTVMTVKEKLSSLVLIISGAPAAGLPNILWA